MCAGLAMRIIPASSPQAKGRVERNHGTHQDRLVKKMRRLGLADDATANIFLTTRYWPAHNARFAQPAAAAEDFHRRAPSARDLDRVFRLEETRVVGQDWVVQYHSAPCSCTRRVVTRPRAVTVSVCEWEDGRLAIEYRGQAMRWTELAGPRPAVVGAGTRPTPSPPPAARPQPRPGADHPWRQRVDQFRTHKTLWQAMEK